MAIFDKITALLSKAPAFLDQLKEMEAAAQEVIAEVAAAKATFAPLLDVAEKVASAKTTG